MLVLGIDTATWTAAVGVARDGRIVAETDDRTTGSHATLLPRLIAAVLATAGERVEALDAVAVSIGPGSFTGLRIGLGIAKGMAFAGHLPIAAVPTLEGLAHAADLPAGTLVCAAVDARKREVYAAAFRATPGGGRERLSPDEALAPAVLGARLGPEWVIVGDAPGTYPELSGGGARVLPFATVHPRGGVIARLGGERLAAGAASDLGSLEPCYVRRPEAELAREGVR